MKYSNVADTAPSKAKYEAFIEEFTQELADEGTEHAQENYPAMREITGTYMFHEITVK